MFTESAGALCRGISLHSVQECCKNYVRHTNDGSYLPPRRVAGLRALPVPVSGQNQLAYASSATWNTEHVHLSR